MSDPTQSSFSRYQLAELAAPGSDTFVDGPFGSSLKSHEYVDSGVRLIQLQNIGEGEWRDENKKFITSRKFKTLERHGAVPGDIAIAKMADPVARACLVPAVSEQFVVVADCIRLRLDDSRFDAGYVVRSINSPYTRREAEKKAIGSTRVRINLSVLKTVGCLAPELPAQKEITRILDTLDTAIHETEAIIAKLKAVKQGLLHDLLTRGIDANGELRPPQTEAPHLYKESALGWVPKDWDVKQLYQVGEAVTGTTPPSIDPLAWGSGTPFITPSEIADDRPISDSERQVSARGLRYVRLLPAKTIVVVCIGSTIGKVGITATASCTNQQINAVLPYAGIHPEYLFLAIRMYIDQLRGLAGLQAVPIVNKTSFESIFVPVARPSEQIEIAKRLDAISTRLNDEGATLHKLRFKKLGLMDDLLTGRVRVTPLLAEAAQQPGSA